MEKNNKSHSVQIKGWCTFFLFQIGLCAIISGMSFISNFSIYFDVDVSETMINCGMACAILSEICIIVYAILVIHTFIKRKPFAVQLGMSYLFALFLNANCGLIETMMSYNSNVHVSFGNMIGMIWFTIWLVYLYYSKQIDAIFPPSTRITRKRDYLPISLIVLPPILWIIIITYNN